MPIDIPRTIRQIALDHAARVRAELAPPASRVDSLARVLDGEARNAIGWVLTLDPSLTDAQVLRRVVAVLGETFATVLNPPTKQGKPRDLYEMQVEDYEVQQHDVAGRIG